MGVKKTEYALKFGIFMRLKTFGGIIEKSITTKSGANNAIMNTANIGRADR